MSKLPLSNHRQSLFMHFGVKIRRTVLKLNMVKYLIEKDRNGFRIKRNEKTFSEEKTKRVYQVFYNFCFLLF